MSRIGQTPILIPDNVDINLQDDALDVKGPKGNLTQTLHPLISLTKTNSSINVNKKNDTKLARSLHGTYQRLISNMVKGVTEGFEKRLELVGTGYRVAKQADKLTLSLGFSHPVEYQPPSGVAVQVEGNNQITISGPDKQVVGQVAATIRKLRPPEPYKGKGIRYQGETIRRKAGKTAKSAE